MTPLTKEQQKIYYKARQCGSSFNWNDFTLDEGNFAIRGFYYPQFDAGYKNRAAKRKEKFRRKNS